MSEAQWQAVQRLMAGILPEWTGTDLKQRSARQQSVVQQLWKLAGTSAEFLQGWKVKSAAGNEWLRQREESKGWLQLVLRAWREEVERHGGRDGRALPLACLLQLAGHRHALAPRTRTHSPHRSPSRPPAQKRGRRDWATSQSFAPCFPPA